MSSEVLLELRGRFDVDAALRLVEQVSLVPLWAELVLDFGGVHELPETALIALVDRFPMSAGRPLRTRGLSRHQRVVLRYLGAPPAFWQTEAVSA